MHGAERGLFDLQRGRPLYVTTSGSESADAGVLVASVECLQRPVLEQLNRVNGGGVRLILTPHRVRATGWAPDQQGHVSVALNGEADPDRIVRLATSRVAGTTSLEIHGASAPEVAGLMLAKLAGLVPAVVAVPANPVETPELRDLLESGAVLATTSGDIEALVATGRFEVTYVSEGPVPLQEAENARFLCFREVHGLIEHVAIVIGDQASWPDPVPVRLHSACLTGDLFGSLRCDCGEQLRASLRVFGRNGGGVLLYLSQEGRGIGLGNKLRAYRLQQEGLDTIDADGVLGFGADERRYDAAVGILRHLGIERIQLLTNNPEKVRAVVDSGIEVIDRKPLYGKLNRHNDQYITAKAHRAGHWLADMLTGAVPGK